jgi:hypothetical protein
MHWQTKKKRRSSIYLLQLQGAGALALGTHRHSVQRGVKADYCDEWLRPA